ncbi:MAG: hypothetical protein ACYDG3_10055 [Bacillati bacterium]
MARITVEELFDVCPPPRPLDIVISQYLPEIERLQKIRAGEEAHRMKRRGGDALADYVISALGPQRPVITVTPFELFTKVRNEVVSKDVHGDEVVQVISAPIHYGSLSDMHSMRVETEPVRTGSENLDQMYQNAVNRALVEHSDELRRQRFTQSDIITINRRLIEKNIRCVPCLNRSATCFRYDWLKGELL